jgi:ubiquinone/menaquinone biosynthesis C-methylase UbiE
MIEQALPMSAQSKAHSWLSYWESPNRSYVSERHKRAHYEAVFAGTRPHLPRRGGVVLDWGCGDALAAPQIADLCGTVLLYEAAESTCQRLRQRYTGDPRIRVLKKDELNARPSESIDLIVVNSVIQYLSSEDFDAALGLFQRLLKQGGSLLLGDVISPGTGNIRHVRTFLEFARRKRFLAAAIWGLARTYASSYRRLQRDVGLAAYDAAEMLRRLAEHGFAAEKLTRNIAVSTHRSAYLARKASIPRDQAHAVAGAHASEVGP